MKKSMSFQWLLKQITTKLVTQNNKMCYPTALDIRSPKDSQRHRGCVPSESSWGDSVPFLFQILEASAFPGWWPLLSPSRPELSGWRGGSFSHHIPLTSSCTHSSTFKERCDDMGHPDNPGQSLILRTADEQPSSTCTLHSPLLLT